MSSAPASASPAPVPASGWGARLGLAALWSVLFLSMLKLPAPVATGLDPSWRMVIGHAVGRGFQWGHDLIFTYGPLGYLLASTNHGEHYHHFLVWQVVSNALFATIVLLLGRQFQGWRALAFYAYILAFVANYLDAMHLTMVLLITLALLREPAGGRRWLVVAGGLVLALLSLVKFTNLMLAGFGLACVVGHHLWRRRWLDAALAGGSSGGGFLLGWLLCGQSLRHLPSYLLTSLDASGAYGEGMAFTETPLVFALGLAGAFGVGAYYLLSLWRRRDLPLALATVLVVAAGSFLNWKHGYVRADGHVFAHFIACLLIPITFPVLLADDGPLRRLKVACLSVATAAAVAGILVATPSAITDAPAIWNYNLKTVFNALRILPELRRNADAEFTNIGRLHSLPGIRAVVGDDTIDMIGNEQAYLLFNRFNYRPRPAFQSYLPYSVAMMRANEAFFRSPRAPRYVLQKLDTIDQRLPGLEDSLSTRYVYYHYRFVMEEKGMLLHRRAEHDPALDREELIATRRVAFGDPVQVPERSDQPVWAEVVVRPSLLGRLRNFLYKAPLLTLKVVDGGGFRNDFRLIRQMAGEGFFAYPHFTNGYNIQRYLSGDPATRIASFAVEVPAHQRKYYRPEIEVRFLALPPIPRSQGIVSATPQAQYRMFDRVPDAVQALFPVSSMEAEGREVLFAHPPATLEFRVDSPVGRLRGKFGFSPNAYAPPNATDGAEFIVEWHEPGGQRTELFSRHLQPGQDPADRGLQSFDIALPSGVGRLTLRITPGPAGDIACDWTYWTDLRFVP